ncbi:twin-arginine translocation pathway signal protein [Sphingomonas sp. DBB INV C78]
MLAIGASSVIAPQTAFAMLGERRLAFRNVHNNERIDARYWGASGIDRDGLAEINHGMRDWRTGDVASMDPSLIDLLVTLRDKLGASPRTSFDLISGYRSPRTNASLRAHGGGGVATKSQHMLGKASDIALPGVRLETVRSAALSIGRGGVGFYPRDGFVHVDTGRVRTW